MASNALGTQGISVKVGDGAETEAFTTIAEVTGFSGPTTEASEIETTTLASAAKEFIAGLVDNGDVTLEVNGVPRDVQHRQLRADISDGAKRNYQIDFNDKTESETSSTTYTFKAFVKSFPLSAAADDKLSGTITLRISGAITDVIAS